MRYKGSASPFDEWVWNGRVLLCIECKMLKEHKGNNPKSFSYDRVTKDQEEGLLTWNKFDNTKGIILINFRWIDHKKGKCFALPINDFVYLRDNTDKSYEGLNNKSIKLNYFKDNVLELDRLGKGWDLRQILSEENGQTQLF